MAKSREINMNLPSVDDLFTTQEERDQKNQEYVKDISIYEITDFPNHPFKVKMDDKMLETIESVRDHGVLVPALVREKPTGGYEMISGHRRKMASELAGKETMPCIVRNLSDDQAVIVMVDSNLQREEILPSEKAFAYKMKLEAMKRQAGRPRKNSVPVAQEFRGKTSREILGEQVGESQDQIRRYIRLTELIPEILEMVDDKKISMCPAVEQWKIPKNRLKKYFPSGTSQQKMEETIIKALELYRKREKSRERCLMKIWKICRLLDKKVKRSGLNREAYLRQLISGVVPRDASPPDYYSMMRELHKIGNNLNQIAQKAHVLNVVDVQRYDKEVRKFNEAVRKITEAVILPEKNELWQ